MKKSTITILIALSLLATGFILGAHPLVDHFGETAQSGAGTFGSQWIHTDTKRLELAPWVSEEEPFLVVPTPPAPPIDPLSVSEMENP